MRNALVASSDADASAHSRGASNGARRNHRRPGRGFLTDSDE
jgi:hypothetical protein